jgi:hypothetical protein
MGKAEGEEERAEKRGKEKKLILRGGDEKLN